MSATDDDSIDDPAALAEGGPDTPERRRAEKARAAYRKFLDWRDADVVSAYRRGESVYSIGDRHGLSRARVRQILREHDVPLRAQRRVTIDAEVVLAGCLRARSGMEAARSLGVPYDTVLATLRKHRKLESCRQHWRMSRRQKLLERMRVIGESLGGRAPTAAELKEAGISANTCVQFFGSLGNAQRLAGFDPRAPGEKLGY